MGSRTRGLFRRYGSDPDLILIEGAPAAPRLFGRHTDHGYGRPAGDSARARGADLILFMGMVKKMNYILVTSQAIKKSEDLKGKRIEWHYQKLGKR